MHRAIAVATVVLLTATSSLSAVIEVMLTPLYIGSRLAPVTLLFAVVGNVFFARMAWDVTRRTLAASLPLIAWTSVVLAASTSRREGDVLLPGGANGWVAWMLIILGIGSGMSTVLRRVVVESRPRPGDLLLPG